jgi:hypothetical protein
MDSIVKVPLKQSTLLRILNETLSGNFTEQAQNKTINETVNKTVAD